MLGFRLLDNVHNKNSFDIVDELELYDGNNDSVYFVLMQDIGIRYIPDAGALIEVKFENIDSNKVITRPSSQPFPLDDRSICKVLIMQGEKFATGGMRVFLTESGVKKELKALSDFVVTASDIKRFVC